MSFFRYNTKSDCRELGLEAGRGHVLQDLK